MNIYMQLKKLNLLNWNVIMMGFEKALISKKDIEDYAVSMIRDSDEFDPELSLLASARMYNDEEIKDIILTQLKDDVKNLEEINKLRLASLLALNEENIDDVEKCDKLQMIYEDFNYPKDMYDCSIYREANKISPIEAMNNLIADLKRKYIQSK